MAVLAWHERTWLNAHAQHHAGLASAATVGDSSTFGCHLADTRPKPGGPSTCTQLHSMMLGGSSVLPLSCVAELPMTLFVHFGAVHHQPSPLVLMQTGHLPDSALLLVLCRCLNAPCYVLSRTRDGRDGPAPLLVEAAPA
jgi:hypothetical protein